MFKYNLKKALHSLFTVFFSILLWMSASFAAKASAPTIDLQLQVSQKIHTENNGEPIQTSFSYSLIPLDPDFPLPQGTQENVFIFSIDGNTDYTFPSIFFKKSGTYSYRIKQNVPSSHDNIKYDERIYRIDFYIENNDFNLRSPLLVITEEGADKVEHIIFENTVPEKKRPITEHDNSGTSSDYTILPGSISTVPSEAVPDMSLPLEEVVPPDRNRPASAQTGDNTPVLILIFLLIISLSGILYYIRRTAKR